MLIDSDGYGCTPSSSPLFGLATTEQSSQRLSISHPTLSVRELIPRLTGVLERMCPASPWRSSHKDTASSLCRPQKKVKPGLLEERHACSHCIDQSAALGAAHTRFVNRSVQRWSVVAKASRARVYCIFESQILNSP
jgi:hypothetical protein